ncbi:MAG: DUF4105 domain-containing protein [Halorhodospira halophila]|uniref:Lnb N-terminal periplasmic domain-containing protein n=1 Tax=Halorhodospira halophila TaxID=1053 RepID=UPI0026EEAE47|nr:DUF4105 domain-containing protein [Halorhodospira halophila]MCC3751588.1 DUF4105 domain-containing protein [Halorhodospira halophila]
MTERPMRLALALCCAVLLSGVLCLPRAVAAPIHAGALAEILELADDPRWLRLIGYEHRAFRTGREGMVRTPGFYFHEHGHEDPRAELRATLKALYAPVVPGAEDSHAACRFPARRQLLVEALGLEARGYPLPDPDCAAYEAWRERIATERVMLIFADAYMGNPASMFGHTLLRLDGEEDLQRPLTAFAVNHAAQTGEDQGVVFAMRGVLGSYPGSYTVMPYYYKVNEYTQLEQRDLWEYELDLDEDAIDRLLSHLWELDGVGMPYYFFLQNCSYRLLSLLEIADPTLSLRDDFRFWAIPSDTIRAVTEEPGLLRDVHYRPSRRRTLDHMLAGLEDEHTDWVRELAHGDRETSDEAIQALPEADRARVVEAASAYLDQLAHVEPIGDEGRERRHRLLSERARTNGPRAEPPPRPDQRPDEGHRTGRLGVGIGSHSRVGYGELQWRAAYHDLLDPAAGYLRGAQVTFLEVIARMYENRSPRQGRKPDGGLEVERLTLMELRSMEPRNRTFPGWAWGGKLGIERIRADDGRRPLAAVIDADFGPAWAWLDDRLRLYGGGAVTLRASRGLGDSARLGGGLRGDAVYQGGAWRAHLTGSGLRFTDNENAWTLSAEIGRDLGEQTALRLGLHREEDFGIRSDRVQLTLHHYL